MTTPTEYAEEVERVTDEAVAFARSCTPGEWATLVPGEDWPVGVLVHHVALGFDRVTHWIDAALAGEPIEETGEEVDADNAEHAEAFAGVGVEETVELLRANSAAVVGRIAGLTEEELSRSTAFAPAGGKAFSAGQFCGALVAHIERHIGNAKSAVRGGDEA